MLRFVPSEGVNRHMQPKHRVGAIDETRSDDELADVLLLDGFLVAHAIKEQASAVSANSKPPPSITPNHEKRQ